MNIGRQNIVFALFFLLFNCIGFAQLSGTYTIDQTGLATATNYSSIEAAVSDINSGVRSDLGPANGSGISGPVVFNVVSGTGPYVLVNKVELNSLPNSSSTNSISFNGNGNTVQHTAQSSAARVTFSFNGCDHIIFRDFIFELGGGQAAIGFHLFNQADSNIIEDCIFNNNLTATTNSYANIAINKSSTTIGSSLGDNGSYNIIRGNQFNGGNIGVSITGNSAAGGSVYNRIENNKFSNFYSTGVYLYNTTATYIEDNDISRQNRPHGAIFYGVNATSSSSANSGFVVIRRNKIHHPNANPGNIYAVNAFSLREVYGTKTTPSILENNLVYDVNGVVGAFYGLFSSGCRYLNVYNNTIISTNQSAATKNHYGFYITGTSFCNVVNNIVYFDVDGTGTLTGLQMGGAPVSLFTDHNNIYLKSTLGNTYYASHSGAHPTLSDYQGASGMGFNSLSVDPQFADSSIQDYRPLNSLLWSGGKDIGLLEDIHLTRRGNKPDIGAFEHLYDKDVGITKLLKPKDSCGYGNSVEVAVEIQNFGEVSQTNFNVQIEVLGPNNKSITTESVGSLSIPPKTSANYVFTNKVNLDKPGVYKFYLRTKLTGDNDSLNDPLIDSITVYPKLEVNAGLDSTICKFGSLKLGGAPVASGGFGNYTYAWSPQGSLDDPGLENPLSSPTTNTSYTVSVIDGLGCQASDDITITIGSSNAPVVAAGSDENTCAGTGVLIGGTNVATGGQSPYTYAWMPSQTVTNPSASQSIAKPRKRTNYTLTVTDDNGCVGADVVTVFTKMSGTYTVGGNGSDFKNIFEAIQDLEQIGVCGPTVLDIQNIGTTYKERIYLTSIPGASRVNTITFQGNNQVLEYETSSTVRSVIELDSADHIIIDGFKLDVSENNYGWGIHMRNGADSNVIRNCEIKTSALIKNWNFIGIVFAENLYDDRGMVGTGNLIESNTIIGGMAGISLYGKSDMTGVVNTIIRNNRFLDFIKYGVRIYNNDATIVEGNYFTRENSGKIENVTYVINVDSDNPDNKGIKIIRNRIYSSIQEGDYESFNFYGIYFSNQDQTTSGNKSLVANNLIYNINNIGLQHGIYLKNSDYVDVYHNTIDFSLKEVGTFSISQYAFYVSGGANVNFYYNIGNLTSDDAGIHYMCYQVSSSNVKWVRNVYYMEYGITSVSKRFGYYQGSTKYTFPSWQTGSGEDVNSIYVDPEFNDIKNVDFRATNQSVQNLAYPSLVKDDIYKIKRSITRPDPGAFEVESVINDIGAIGLVSPQFPICQKTVDVEVKIKNFGTNGVYDGMINWSLNGTLQTPYHFVYPLRPFKTTDVRIGQATFLPGQTYSIKVWTSLPNGNVDVNFRNDTFMIDSFVVGSLNGIYTVGPGGDFPGIKEVQFSLMTYGVCGPVTFELLGAPDNYKENLTLGKILGSSLVNTVTIDGKGLKWEPGLLNSQNPTFIDLQGTSYFTIKNTILDAESKKYCFAIRMGDRAEFNTVKNCSILLERSASTFESSSAVVFSQSNSDPTTYGVTGRNITLEGNYFSGGYSTIYLSGHTLINDALDKIYIRNNKFIDFTNYGIRFVYADDVYIEGNEFYRILPKSSGGFSCLSFTQSNFKNSYFEIIGNKFHDPFPNSLVISGTAYVCDLNKLKAPTGQINKIHNNAIYNIKGMQSGSYGFRMTGCEGIEVYHNTIELNDSINFNTANSSAALYTTSSSDLYWANNIIFINRQGQAMKYCLRAGNLLSNSNENVLYPVRPPNNITGFYAGSNQPLLLNWQNASGFDTASVEIDPKFQNVAIGDLRPTEPSIQDMCYFKGVLKDINGKYRSTTRPDPGAIETYTGKDLAIIDIVNPRTGCSLSNAEKVKLHLVNSGTQDATNLRFGYQVTGPINSGPYNENATGYTVTQNTEDTFTFNLPLNVSAIGNYTVKVWLYYLGDENVDNDTFVMALEHYPQFTVEAGPDQKVCQWNSVQLGVYKPYTGGYGTHASREFYWENSDYVDNPRDSFPNVYPDTTMYFYLTVIDSVGCSASDSVLVRFNSAPIVSAGEDSGVCISGSVPVGGNPSASGGGGFYSYSWSPSSSINNPNSSNTRAAPPDTTSYTLTVTDNNGCKGYDVVQVNVNQMPEFEIYATDTLVCAGEDVRLWVLLDGYEKVKWSTNEENDTIEVKPPKKTNYLASVYDNHGCTTNEFIDIHTYELYVSAGADIKVCGGLGAQIGGTPTIVGGSGTYLISWTPTTGLSNPNVERPFANPLKSTYYTLTVVDVANSCEFKDTMFYEITNNFPIADAGEDQVVCNPGAVRIGGAPTGNGGGGFLTYSWTPSSKVNNTSISNPLGTPSNGENKFVVRVSDQFGCGSSDTMSVYLSTPPVIDAGPDGFLCYSDSLELSGLASSNLPMTFLWTPSLDNGINIIKNPTILNPNVIPIQKTIFTLVVSDSVGCQSRDSLTVDVNPEITLDAGGDKDACLGLNFALGGNPTAVGGTGVFGYNWTPSTGLSSSTSSNPIASLNTSQKYYLNVMDASGCAARDSVLITVFQPPIAQAGPDLSLCMDDRFTLSGNPTAQGGGGSYKYTWSPVNWFVDNTIANPTLIVQGNKSIYLLVEDKNGCIDKDTMNLIGFENPIAYAGPQVIKSCPGVTEVLGGNPAGTSGNPPYTYLWQPRNGLSQDNIANPGARPNQNNTIYTLTVTDKNGCFDRATTRIEFEELKVNAGIDKSICLNENVILGGNPTVSNGNGPYSFAWNHKASLSSSSVANPVSYANISTEYFVNVTDARGCLGEDTVFVFVHQLPQIDAGTDKMICDGSNTTLGGSPTIISSNGVSSINWQPSIYLNNPNTQNPIATVSQATLFTLIIEDTNGCTAQDVVNIQIAPTFQVEAGQDIEACEGERRTLGSNPTISPSNGAYTIIWSPSLYLNNAYLSNPELTLVKSQKVHIKVKDAYGCEEHDSLNVVVNPRPKADAGGETKSLCSKSSVLLGGNPAGSGGTGTLLYHWTPIVGLNSPSLPNPTASPANPIVYQLLLTDAKGCQAMDSVSVIFSQPPEIDAGFDQQICSGEKIYLGGQPTIKSGQGPLSINWLPTQSLNDETIAQPQASPNFTTNYQLEVVDKFGCVATDEILITVLASPIVDAGQDIIVCYNDAGTLGGSPTASGGSGMYSYNWMPSNDLSGPYTSNPTSMSKTTKTYTVTVHDANGCVRQDSIKYSVDKQVVSNFNSTKTGRRVDFTELSQNAQSFYWEFGDGTYASLPNPTHMYAGSGTYMVCLEVESVNGCIKKTCKEIAVENNVGVTGNLELSSIKIYPNPTYDGVKINFADYEGIEGKVRIIDINSRGVYEFLGVFPEAQYISLENYSPGNYFVQIIVEDKVITEIVSYIKF